MHSKVLTMRFERREIQIKRENQKKNASLSQRFIFWHDASIQTRLVSFWLNFVAIYQKPFIL